jgi:hypothetical protein
MAQAKKYKVAKTFKDAKTGRTYNPGDDYSTTNVSAEEIQVNVNNGNLEEVES